MSKSYSYSIVVERGDKLLINDEHIAPPQDVTAAGEDCLGWALDQVREMYRDIHAGDSESVLTLSVRDHRPGGLVRKATFRDPDSGIDLQTFLGGQHAAKQTTNGTVNSSTAPTETPPEGGGEEDDVSGASDEAEESPSARSATQEPEQQTAAGASSDAEPNPDVEDEQDFEDVSEPEVESKASPDVSEPEPEPEPEPESEPEKGTELEAVSKAPEIVESAMEKPKKPSKRRKKKDAKDKRALARSKGSTASQESEESALTYEERVQKERGWRKIDKSASTRPQVGSAENSGQSKRTGLLAEARKQRTLGVIGAILLVVAVIVGFRVFDGGTSYEAVCVDQRTMTRAATGVACEDNLDTNHRWWFAPETEALPGPGEAVSSDSGSFDEPSGDSDTINWNVENTE